jgi:tRNA A-37 threonylcarbamoyl transferase component Bud32
MSGMSLRKLVPSPDARDAPEALAAMLAAPPPAGAATIKNEPRTFIWKAVLPSGPSAIVKTYRRRSLYDFARETLTRFRAQREFEALSFLARNDIPCSRPVCWACGRDEVSGRFESLVTFEATDTVGLKAYLRSGHADGRWIGPAARLLRRAHDAGFYHGALAPRNILLRTGEARDDSCLFIDTPKSIVFPGSIVGTRMARHDLMTMLGEVRRVVGEGPVAEFLEAYGEAATAIAPLIADIGRYRPTRNTRNRMRAEFLIRRRFG